MPRPPGAILDLLATQFGSRDRVVYLCQLAGLPASRVPDISEPRRLWTSIWMEARQGSSLAWTPLVRVAASELPNNSALAKYLAELGQTAVVGPPRGASELVSVVDLNRLNGPQRRILREVLASVFGRAKTLDMFLVENGFDSLGNVVAQGTFQEQLFDLIDELDRRGRLDDLIEAVQRRYAQNPELASLRQRLRFADNEAESQRVLGAAGLERMVRKAGFEDLNLWARRLVEAGRRVCRIEYEAAAGSVQGTGFLVAADLVLTNYHVIESLLNGAAEPDAVLVTFDYAESSAGPAAMECRVLADDWLLSNAPYGAADLHPDAGLPKDSELDYALLRLDSATNTADEPAREARGWIDLSFVADPQRDDAVVFVLQHPRGEPLKQSIGLLKRQVTPLRLRYDADTDHGSSGGLVLDQRLLPLALHHAGDPSSMLQAEYNQGIPLTLIRAALEADPAVPKFWLP